MVVTNVFYKYFRLTTNGNDEPRNKVKTRNDRDTMGADHA